jgi:hypothetical protein
MQLDTIITGARELAQTYRVTKGDAFCLRDKHTDACTCRPGHSYPMRAAAYRGGHSQP